MFDLRPKRSFAPFGALVGVVLVQYALVIWVVRPRIMEGFVMPTKSMSPTLDPGDRFVVNKNLHPRRWDLVAYWNQNATPAIYCKRLIGLPGERLRFSNGELFVNDQHVTPHPYLPDDVGRRRPRSRDHPTATPRTKQSHLALTSISSSATTAQISADSRIYGLSATSSLVGVVDLIYWPIGKFRIVR